jgi:hypothetical protein
MKAQYAYGVHMPRIGLLLKTIASTETESIERFAEFEPRLNWLEAMHDGYKVKKIVLVELA